MKFLIYGSRAVASALRMTLPLALLMGLATPAMPAPAPTLLRASLIVKNAADSIRFYEQLGFRIELDQSNARRPEGNPFPLNTPSTAVRLVILGSSTGDGGRIGLVEFSAPIPTDNRANTRRTGLGDVVLVFDVADAEAVHQIFLKSGADVLEPPQVYVSRRTTPDGSPLQGRVFHVRDPDGYLIELLEAPKSVAITLDRVRGDSPSPAAHK